MRKSVETSPRFRGIPRRCIEWDVPAKSSRRGGLADRARSKPPRSIKAYSSRLLDRSVLLLKILATGSVEKRLAEFSAAGLHKSTAFRLLEALRRHRLVAVDEVTGRYRLGLGDRKSVV